jgi:hypothetical protein
MIGMNNWYDHGGHVTGSVPVTRPQLTDMHRQGCCGKCISGGNRTLMSAETLRGHAAISVANVRGSVEPYSVVEGA